MSDLRTYLEETYRRLPVLLKRPWQSLDIDYHAPRVERLWQQDGDRRVFLHRIHPCPEGEEPLPHVHPWHSAMKVLTGSYEMAFGVVSPSPEPTDDWRLQYDYHTLGKFTLTAPSAYEMWMPDAWHSVNPIIPSLTLMVIGKPVGAHPSIKNQPKPGNLSPLSEFAIDSIQAETWRVLGHDPDIPRDGYGVYDVEKEEPHA